MIYTYKCRQCEEKFNVTIDTTDITGRYGVLNQEELTKRINEPRKCKCGGELYKIIDHAPASLWFEAGIGKGKISQRFK